MDGSVDAAASGQGGVGGVDDGVHHLDRDVALGDFYLHRLQPLAGPSEEIEDFPLRPGGREAKITSL